jgi:FkbM family methyltransferase
MNNTYLALKRLGRSLLPAYILEAKARHRLSRLAKTYGLTLSFHQDFTEITRGTKVLRIAVAHAVYLPHMMESFDYYFDSVVPLQAADSFIVDLSGPRYHRLIGFDAFPVMFPAHSEPYITTVQYLQFANLTKGNVVLDIGAYAAITSIMFAQLVGKTGAVFAFEADDNNIVCARENMRLAAQWLDVHNITLVESAVWSHCDGLEFSAEGTMGSSAVSIVRPERGPVMKVPSTTIADFCASRRLEKLDFVKIDIEGAEIEVLTASREILSRLKPRLIVEPHHVEGALSLDRCREILVANGYQVHLLTQFGSKTPLIAATPTQGGGS